MRSLASLIFISVVTQNFLHFPCIYHNNFLQLVSVPHTCYFLLYPNRLIINWTRAIPKLIPNMYNNPAKKVGMFSMSILNNTHTNASSTRPKIIPSIAPPPELEFPSDGNGSSPYKQLISCKLPVAPHSGHL